MRIRFGLFSALVWALTACRPVPVVNSALYGDLATLKRSILEAQKRGSLDSGTVKELALAVAGREVRSARGHDAVPTIRGIRACARPLRPVLADRARHFDELGAEATLILLETGVLSPDALFERFHDAESGAWRAVAARATASSQRAETRRELMRDPDERVRRAALAAAFDAADRADTDDLLEAARLDPDPLSQSLATRAVGAVGGEHAVLALKDLFWHASDEERMAIVDAWAMPGALRAGGGRELYRMVETETGLPALAAAATLLRADGDSSTRAAEHLARCIESGSTEERRLAIRLAPLKHPELRQAVVRASSSADPEVGVMGLSRLLGDTSARARAQKELRRIAMSSGEQAVQARAALAVAKDTSIVPKLLEDLRARNPGRRVIAARALVELDRLTDAAPALADDRPEIRAEIACKIVAQAAPARER